MRVIAAKLQFAYGRTGEKSPVPKLLKYQIAARYARRTVFRFENKVKLHNLGFEINTNTIKIGYQVFEYGV